LTSYEPSFHQTVIPKKQNETNDFDSNFGIESAVYTTQGVTPSNELQGVFVMNESDARN